MSSYAKDANKNEVLRGFICMDGPWKGQRILLGLDGRTITFTVSGQTGYYDCGRWVRKAPTKEKPAWKPPQVGAVLAHDESGTHVTVYEVTDTHVKVYNGRCGRVSVPHAELDKEYRRLP